MDPADAVQAYSDLMQLPPSAPTGAPLASPTKGDELRLIEARAAADPTLNFWVPEAGDCYSFENDTLAPC